VTISFTTGGITTGTSSISAASQPTQSKLLSTLSHTSLAN
jgi:hypothetical protein